MPPTATPAPPAAPRWLRLASPALLALAVLATYAGSLRGPFVFDDIPAIVANPSLDSFASALSPPAAAGNTVGGRPLLNLSFALNRTLGGLDVRGYHAVNILIHALAALALFGALRLLLTRLAHPQARLLSFTAALLWAVHPLGTAAVTYTVQRAESLSALLVLVALGCFLRAASRPARDRTAAAWLAASAAAVLAAAATKETAAAAPLLILLIDRTLFASGFRAALRARPVYYAGLGASWLLLASLVAGTSARGGSAGFETPVAVWPYLLTQGQAVFLYLRLALWPHPLVFDYGSPVVTSALAAAPFVALLLALLVAIIWRLRHPMAPAISAHGDAAPPGPPKPLGEGGSPRSSLTPGHGDAAPSPRSFPTISGCPSALAGVAFFLLLAPSSSFVPIATQTIAEHRMYLPLAAVVTLLAGGLARLAGRTGLFVLLAAAVPLGLATAARNATYRGAESLWADTVAKRPDNPRAHNNLGLLLAESGRLAEAVAHFETAVRLVPANPAALNNLGNALRRAGRVAEALPHLERAAALDPASAEIRVNLANALHQGGRPAEAAAVYATAATLGPLPADALANHGAILLSLNRPVEAIPVLQSALHADAAHARVHYNLGNAHARLAQWEAAIAHYRSAVQSDPAYLAAHANLGQALLAAGRPAEAAAAYESALRLRPDDPALRAALARARSLAGTR